jgi:hypothetical protein
LWAETKIDDILPWEDVEREAERLLESKRANARNSVFSPPHSEDYIISTAYPHILFLLR